LNEAMARYGKPEIMTCHTGGRSGPHLPSPRTYAPKPASPQASWNPPCPS
jgi:hypothetical protein